MTGPIRPDQVDELKSAQIPEEVFKAFNELIAKHWSGHSARVAQDDVIALIIQKIGDSITRDAVFERKWLDVEQSYRAMGWTVKYNSPSYGDNDFPSYFMFSKS